MKLIKENKEPCQKCGSTNLGREKTYQNFKNVETGKVKEIHNGWLYYCKDCVKKSMESVKYKEKIWLFLDKIEALEGIEQGNQFRKLVGESVKTIIK